MMLRNLDQSGGLCNGTRLVVTNIGDMMIEAQIVTGSLEHTLETLFIYREFL